MFLQTKICPTEYDVWLQPFHFELKSIIISDISKLCNLIQGSGKWKVSGKKQASGKKKQDDSMDGVVVKTCSFKFQLF